MAKYGGSFVQGLAGGIQTGLNYGMQAAQIRWQNDQKKKLEAEKSKMQEVWTNFAQSAQQIYESGEMSEETERKLYALMFTLPPELQASANNLLTAVNKNDKASAEKEFNNLKMVMEVVESTGGRVDDVALDSLINILSPENQEKIRAVMSAYKSVPEQPTPEVFTSPQALLEKYPDSGYTYSASAGGYVPTYQKPTKADQPPTELDLMAETQKKLDYAYNTGNASYFNKTAKALGVDTTFDTYKQGYEKAGVVGEETETLGSRTGSLPQQTQYREKLDKTLTANEWDSIIKEYTSAKDTKGRSYDASVFGSYEEHATAKLQGYYDNLIKNKIIDPNTGKLIKGKTKGKDSKGNAVEADNLKVYEIIRKKINTLIDELQKKGVDVSQYKKLKPLSEIEKKGLEKINPFDKYPSGSIYY